MSHPVAESQKGLTRAGPDKAVKLDCGSVDNVIRLPRKTAHVTLTLPMSASRDALVLAVRSRKGRSARSDLAHARLSTFGLVRSPSEIAQERASVVHDGQNASAAVGHSVKMAAEASRLDKEERVFWSFRLEQVRRETQDGAAR